MALPCPQRDALEALQQAKWSKKCGKCRSFHLLDGTPLHLLGISNGTGMRDNPNLHIAVFGYEPPRGEPQNANLLADCGFSAVLSGPEDGNLFTVEALSFVEASDGVAVLSQNGHKERYRSIV